MEKQGGRGNNQVSRALCIWVSCAFGPGWPSNTSLFSDSGYALLSLPIQLSF